LTAKQKVATFRPVCGKISDKTEKKNKRDSREKRKNGK
jgi:hypothetical protein